MNKQAVLDIFAGDWLSKMPSESNLTTLPGTAPLFEDDRIKWAEEMHLGGFKGKRILELGPLEAGHTYMLHQMGAKEIVSIEANSQAFLKCLCIKEIFKLDRANFLFGDFFEFLKSDTTKYDTIIASGVLYHSMQPLELLKLISERTKNLFLWTHYYGDQKDPDFDPPILHHFEGTNYALRLHHYGEALNRKDFCGGTQSTSIWMARIGILTLLEKLGFELTVNFETPNHPHGPAFAIYGTRK